MGNLIKYLTRYMNRWKRKRQRDNEKIQMFLRLMKVYLQQTWLLRSFLG